MMVRRQALLLPVLCLLVCRLGTAADCPARPNIVILLADDQGWGDLRVHGNTNLETPNIDSLARDGALFERFYVCAVCAPRGPSSSPDDTTCAEVCWAYRPARSGWTSMNAPLRKLSVRQVTPPVRSASGTTAANGPIIPMRGGSRSTMVSRPAIGASTSIRLWNTTASPFAARAMSRTTSPTTRSPSSSGTASGPSSATSRTTRPTPPLPCRKAIGSDSRISRSRSVPRTESLEDLDVTRCALAMCENLDWNVGRVLRRLEELKLADNTIVLYFTDNGPNSWRWNGGMKGRKGSTDEGGVRVPMLMRWPAKIKPGTRVSPIAGAIDLLPTLVSLAGIERVGDRPLDGEDLSPLLLGTAQDWPDRMIFSHWNGKVSVRTQQYRLDERGALFDMVTDPGQQTDVASQHSDVAARLVQAVEAWRQNSFPPHPSLRKRLAKARPKPSPW